MRHTEETKQKLSQLHRDNRLHKFAHEDGREVVGFYIELRQNAQALLGISKCSVQKLKQGNCQSVKGWSYQGLATQSC